MSGRHALRRYPKTNLKLPERWEKYTSIGTVVPGTRFLPFKTPLKEEICRRSLSSKHWFTPAMLLEKAPKLKLIIDLTQTDRFYTREYFNERGVRHYKIICPGGGKSLPSREIIQKFTQTINDFLASEDGLNKDSLIGVHCTHGLNRTGYLICKYMVEHDGVSAKDAIEAFEDARGHKIERELYTCDILNKPLPVNTTRFEDTESSYYRRGPKYNSDHPYAEGRRNYSNSSYRPDSYSNNWREGRHNYSSSNYRHPSRENRHNYYSSTSRHRSNDSRGYHGNDYSYNRATRHD